MRHLDDEVDVLGLSFVDVLSCGLGASVFLFLVFSAMPHLGVSDELRAPAQGAVAPPRPPIIPGPSEEEPGALPVAVEVWLPGASPIEIRWAGFGGNGPRSVRGGDLSGELLTFERADMIGPVPTIYLRWPLGSHERAEGFVRVLVAGRVEERTFAATRPPGAQERVLASLWLVGRDCFVRWDPDVVGQPCGGRE